MLSKVKGLAFYNEAGKAVPPAPRGDVATGAWFGSVALKRNTVEKMMKHREQDQIIQGLYQSGLLVGDDSRDVFKGCLVGCTLPPFNAEWYEQVNHQSFDGFGNGVGWHSLVERFYNIQTDLAIVLDNWFEEQFEENAPDFAVDALEAIPVGAVYSDEQLETMSQMWSEAAEDVEKFLEMLRNPAEMVLTVSAAELLQAVSA